MAQDPERHVDKAFVDAIMRFTAKIGSYQKPHEVLNALNTASEKIGISVLGAKLNALRYGDLASLEVDKTVFIHKSVSKEFWDEYFELSRLSPSINSSLARLTIAPFTMTEMMQLFRPIGFDRWPIDLALKYGFRDVLTCPVGGKWLVLFYSRAPFGDRLDPETRSILFLGASFAGIQLQRIVEPGPARLGNGTGLTTRELMVLRWLSNGKRLKETAELLEIGVETVRSHFKKAAAKLGVKDRGHAIAQALRLHLIE